MGDALGAVFGGGERTSASTTPDATAQALNRTRLNQLQPLFDFAPYAGFAFERPDIYSPAADVGDLYRNIGTSDLGLGPLSLGDVPENDYSDLMSFDDYLQTGLDQTQNYISQIATPEIMSQLALSGLESSGAVPEAIAKATASIGLPFVQSLPQASTALTLAPIQGEATRAQTGLLQGQRSLLPYNAALTNAQGGLLNAQRAGTLFPLADYGRGLAEEDLLRRQGVVTTGLTGLPFTPGSTQKGRTSQQPLFNFFGQG